MPSNECGVCGNQANVTTRDGLHYYCDCPRCGRFSYDPGLPLYKPDNCERMVLLSGWIREQTAAGIRYVQMGKETALRVMRRKRPPLGDRAMRALSVFARKYPSLKIVAGAEEIAGDLELQCLSYSADYAEVCDLLLILNERGYLSAPNNMFDLGFMLTVPGLLAAEALGASGSNAPQGFVAMSFDDSLREAWINGFHPAILSAGYQPMRIDDGKDYIGGITDEIIAEIRRSRFVVADYTQQKNGVYFEAGFALGLGLPVVATCREDEIDKLHFDIRRLNTIAWTSPTDLSDRLSKRIRAVIGEGPSVT
jgi:hypothetical protein